MSVVRTGGGSKSLSAHYSKSKVDNRKETFSIETTRFAKLSCSAKPTQPIQLIQLI